MKVLISIVVPVYNSSKVLKRCISSILNQSYSYWELILVNDGSTDNSLSICSEYAVKDKRIYVVDKKNGGVSSARNAGIHRAKGEYICFVDSDDSLESSFLSTLIQAVLRTNADLTICGLKTVSLDNNVKESLQLQESLRGRPDIANFVQKHYLEWLVSSPCGKLYKRAQLPTRGFDEGFSLGEDLKFNIEYFQKIYSVEVLPVALYNYFDTEGSLTKKYKPGHLEAINEIYRVTKRYIDAVEGVDKSHFKNVNYKLFSFCISFMSQNMKKSNRTDEIAFIKQIVDNENLQSAVLFLPKIDLVRWFYAQAIKKKGVKLLYIYSLLKYKFIDKY